MTLTDAVLNGLALYLLIQSVAGLERWALTDGRRR